MSVEQILIERSSNACELCGSTENLSVYEITPGDGSADQSLYLCETCVSQINNPENLDNDHWRCLNDSMWSQTPAVQVMAYRLLSTMGAQDQLDMMYLEDDVKTWAEAGMQTAGTDTDENGVVQKDSNGAVLAEGDSVTLIKDLDVKGGGFTAKRGTVVKNIHLTDDARYIEGKINGSVIVIVAAYTKKAN